jgi:hypothetical protein
VKIGDFAKNFQISGFNESDSIISGDRVNLTCSATTYEHSGIINWYMNDELIDGEENDLNITRSFTNYTWISSILIDEVSKEHEGEYKCEVQDKINGLMHTKSVEIVVHDSYPPVIETRLVKSSERLEIGDELTIECEVVKGLPEPTLKW